MFVIVEHLEMTGTHSAMSNITHFLSLPVWQDKLSFVIISTIPEYVWSNAVFYFHNYS